MFDHAPVPFRELSEELLAGREALGGRVAEAGVCEHLDDEQAVGEVSVVDEAVRVVAHELLEQQGSDVHAHLGVVDRLVGVELVLVGLLELGTHRLVEDHERVSALVGHFGQQVHERGGQAVVAR